MTNPDNGTSLLFGPMELIDPNRIDFSVEVLAEGLDFGSPQPIEVAIRSLMQQGTNMVNRGWDNREGTGARVIFTATDLDKIGAGEQELMAQIGKRNTLTWTPPGGLGAPTQFVIMTSSFDPLPDDLAEVTYPPTAQYSIRFVPEPFPRSTITVRAPALRSGGITRDPVDDCSSASLWTGSPEDPTTDGSSLSFAGDMRSPIVGTRTGPIDTSSLKYLEVQWGSERDLLDTTADITAQSTLKAWADGRLLARASGGKSASGLPLTVFLVPDDIDTIDVLKVERSGPAPAGGASVFCTLLVHDISVSDIRPKIGSNRQLNRIVEIDGSAPCDGTLEAATATGVLGEVLIYVYPDSSYIPALGFRRVSGEARTPDATKVSGAYSHLVDDVYEIPVSEIADGTHELVAVLGYTGVERHPTITWDAQVWVDETPVSEMVTGSADLDFTVLPFSVTGYTAVLLGDLQLPDWQLGDGSTAFVRLQLHADPDDDVAIDEALIFNTDIGYLTHVRCPIDEDTGAGPNRIWLTPATIETNIPKVLIGTAADQSDAYHPGLDQLMSWMPPFFEPPTARLHLVNLASSAVESFVDHQPRWHTRARRVIGQ